MIHTEDRDLVDLYLARDESAIALTADRYGSRLRALAYGILRDASSAEECENDVYLAAWNSIPPHRPWDYFYPFLARIARHIALDLCRSRSRLKRSAHLCALTDELAQCLPAPDDCLSRLEQADLTDAIDRFLRTLDPEKRAIFLRRYWFLDPVADIARRFALSESKVKTTLYRLRGRLRAHLEKEGHTL